MARRLRERGHEVLVAARDLVLATEVLAAAGIRFVQSPADRGVISRQPQSYADVLLMQGWESPARLWGLVQAWGNLLRLFRADALVFDYAPTALLAARILGVPSALLGTGFELPPLAAPLPPFPGFTSVSAEQARTADARALDSANRVLEAYQAAPLAALCDLFRTECRWLTTFAELDQYGPRSGEIYLGPIGDVEGGEVTEWAPGFKHRVLAYVRPGMADLTRILRALAGEGNAAVICAAPGVPMQLSEGLNRPGFQFIPRAVNFRALLPQASTFISYAPAGSVAQSLLQGVPQLMSPTHVEAQMTAVRVASLGAGLTLRGEETESQITTLLRRILDEPRFKIRALEFASRHRTFDGLAACDRIVTEIEQLLAGDARVRGPSGAAA
ncbi:MAG TPA: nucleotide disphospho-sugar-binding domain-containing protein [Steroidobacteraceae bacterium]|nr:nucleotide disphospho-sugar-binding domain-containing protein [Steroidobacteraceae bacterium]